MNYNFALNKISQVFTAELTKMKNIEVIPTDDFGWENYRWKSDVFRLAHIERYSDNKIEVLHVTTFPHEWSPEPIFGFDVICTNNMVVGMYMDLSPGLIAYPFDEGVDFKERKPLPEWATVFSDRFILLKPDNDKEFIRFSNWVLNKYKWYLSVLQNKATIQNIDDVIVMQNKYCEVQSQNPRTFSVLKSKIGEERAQFFMKEVLFPRIIPL